jgi:tRNA(fMet)-specific endonuclease VapC
MILIDTDHATYLKYPESERGRRFINRLAALRPSEVVGVAIVTVEERMRGWLAVIAKKKRPSVR